MPKTGHLLIDGDAVIYPAGFIAASRGVSCDETISNVLNNFHNIFEKSRTILGDRYGIHIEGTHYYFTSKGSPKYRDQFRKYIPYKEYRSKTVAPLYVQEMLAQVAAEFPYGFIMADPLRGEADDYISSAAHTWATPCIVHVDKDLNQIPGLHIDLKDPNIIYNVSPLLGAASKYQQILMGDTADNIPGLNGIGLARSRTIIGKCKTETELFERCLDTYWQNLKSDHDEEYIIDLFYETANLVHLRTNLTDDCWHPPV